MRIVAGKHKGRNLITPKTDNVRPTSDRVRETMFNVLAHGIGVEWENLRVLDLFAGTGALGLEAISRGAEFVMFVEKNKQAKEVVVRNIQKVGVEEQTMVLGRDATKLGRPPKGVEAFGIVFVDPPYNQGLAQQAIRECVRGGWMQSDAIVVVEEHADAIIDLGGESKLLDNRKFDETQIAVFGYG